MNHRLPDVARLDPSSVADHSLAAAWSCGVDTPVIQTMQGWPSTGSALRPIGLDSRTAGSPCATRNGLPGKVMDKDPMNHAADRKVAWSPVRG
jgi:hypothetical protein